jgi:hypothetical protein
MKKKRAPIAAYKPPPNAPPLHEVIMQMAIKSRQLNALDDENGRKLSAIEEGIRRRRSTGGPVDVPFPPWGKLGWSGRRDRGWRLVVVDDEACEDLSAMPRDAEPRHELSQDETRFRAALPTR